MPVQRQIPASQNFRGRLARLILLCLVLVFGIVSLWYVRQRPYWMLEDARKLVPSNPIAAERLLESAVAANGGSFPKAQFLRCQLLAQLGKWDEAIGGFSQIKNFSELPAPELARLADRAAGNGVPLLAELALDAARRQGPGLANILRQSIRFHLEHSHRGTHFARRRIGAARFGCRCFHMPIRALCSPRSTSRRGQAGTPMARFFPRSSLLTCFVLRARSTRFEIDHRMLMSSQRMSALQG